MTRCRRLTRIWTRDPLPLFPRHLGRDFGARLLRADPSLWTVTAWNDNGFAEHAQACLPSYTCARARARVRAHTHACTKHTHTHMGTTPLYLLTFISV